MNSIKKRNIYKNQNKFVICNCGNKFVAKYGVVGLTQETFPKTKYFKESSDAIAYFMAIISMYD